jgi:hypothetical protein
MAKNTVTYIRKSDGTGVEVIMEPVGWAGYKKIFEVNGDVSRIPDAQFEQEYKLPEPSAFARFFRRGIK